MSKTETLRQSAEAANAKRLEALSLDEKAKALSQARSVDELATAIEPLAKALATLSSEATRTLAEIEQKTRAASVDYQRQISATSDNLGMVIRATKQATHELNRAANRLDWSHFALAIATAMLSALLVSGFWLWFSPPTVQTTLDPKAVAEYLKPAVIEAIKNSKDGKPAKGK